MKTKKTVGVRSNFICFPKNSTSFLRSKGQALVEFTLCFLLLLVIIWIPADFGLAFMTGQIATNASREGARIASATPTLPAMPVSCSYPCSSATDILAQTALRLSSAILKNTTITLSQTGTVANCNAMVVVNVTGDHTFFFYQLLNWFGAGIQNTYPIIRQTSMRWEHQC